jgi:molybdenum cofactor cytidylyltransferase
LPRVSGVVLGAGSSRRLGRPKQTLPLGDTTLLGWVVRDVEASSLDHVIVVVGGSEDEARAGLTLTRAEVVSNAAYASGCASSLLAGMDTAGDCDALMLLLGDMPGVDAGVIDAVRADWERQQPWAAVTDYHGKAGHPFVFSAAAFPTLRGLHGDKAVWKILDAQPERVRRVPVDRPLPADIDTWDDYLDVCRTFGFTPAPPAGPSPAGGPAASSDPARPAPRA